MRIADASQVGLRDARVQAQNEVAEARAAEAAKRPEKDAEQQEAERAAAAEELARVREMNRAFEQQMTGTLSPPKSPPRAPVTPTKETPFKVSTAAVGAQI